MPDAAAAPVTAAKPSISASSAPTVDAHASQEAPLSSASTPTPTTSEAGDAHRRQHSTTKARAPFRLAGEMFCIEPDAGVVYIRHPRWSLLGAGETLLDAERDLLEEARELSPLLMRRHPTELDPETLRLRDFLLRIV